MKFYVTLKKIYVNGTRNFIENNFYKQNFNVIKIWLNNLRLVFSH